MLDYKWFKDFEYIKTDTGSESVDKLVFTLCCKTHSLVEHTSNRELIVFEHPEDAAFFLRQFENASEYVIVPTRMRYLYVVLYESDFKLLYKRRTNHHVGLFTQLKKAITMFF